MVNGAHNRTRTGDLFLTKEVLCQLSYVGIDLRFSCKTKHLMVGALGFEPR